MQDIVEKNRCGKFIEIPEQVEDSIHGAFLMALFLSDGVRTYYLENPIPQKIKESDESNGGGKPKSHKTRTGLRHMTKGGSTPIMDGLDDLSSNFEKANGSAQDTVLQLGRTLDKIKGWIEENKGNIDTPAMKTMKQVYQKQYKDYVYMEEWLQTNNPVEIYNPFAYVDTQKEKVYVSDNVSGAIRQQLADFKNILDRARGRFKAIDTMEITMDSALPILEKIGKGLYTLGEEYEDQFKMVQTFTSKAVDVLKTNVTELTSKENRERLSELSKSTLHKLNDGRKHGLQQLRNVHAKLNTEPNKNIQIPLPKSYRFMMETPKASPPSPSLTDKLSNLVPQKVLAAMPMAGIAGVAGVAGVAAAKGLHHVMKKRGLRRKMLEGDTDYYRIQDPSDASEMSSRVEYRMLPYVYSIMYESKMHSKVLYLYTNKNNKGLYFDKTNFKATKNPKPYMTYAQVEAHINSAVANYEESTKERIAKSSITNKLSKTGLIPKIPDIIYVNYNHFSNLHSNKDLKKTEDALLKYNNKSIDKTIVYEGITYVLDSMLMSNFNKDLGDHLITGITCNDKQYIYTGSTPNKRSNKSCKIVPFEWFSENAPFCFDKMDCIIHKKKFEDNVSEHTCYNKTTGSRVYTYVKKPM